jgi:hypothetical protein
MTTWTTSELDRIAGADELQISPERGDGTPRRPTTIWVVRDGDDLYVRSYRGAGSAWYRAAHSSHTGRITSGGVTKEVTFAEEANPAVNDRVDAAYRTKYGRYTGYVEPMIAEQARATTLKLQPH